MCVSTGHIPYILLSTTHLPDCLEVHHSCNTHREWKTPRLQHRLYCAQTHKLPSMKQLETFTKNKTQMHPTLPNNGIAQNTLTRDGWFLKQLRQKSGSAVNTSRCLNINTETQKTWKNKECDTSKSSRFSIPNLKYMEVDETPNEQLKRLLSKRDELKENTRNNWAEIIKDLSKKFNEEVRFLKRNHGNLGSEKKSNKEVGLKYHKQTMWKREFWSLRIRFTN